MPPKPSSVPLAVPIARAIGASSALARLSERMRESNARFEAICAELPEPLRLQVRPGPLDTASWSLLAANAAVAAKLRQLAPRLDDALRANGFQPIPMRIRVQSS